MSHGTRNEPCLNYLYGTGKLHKTPFRLRFILGVSKKLSCQTTCGPHHAATASEAVEAIQSPLCTSRSVFNPTAKLLERSLVALHHSLAMVSQMQELDGQPPFWFATLDIDEVIARFSMNATPDSVYDVGDFATMYTRLKHELLKEAIIVLHVAVLSWLCDRYQRPDIVLDISRGSWCEGDDSKLRGRAALADLLNDVVDSTYIVTSECVWHQDEGVPMGGPASPELATLYCTYRELLHVRATRQALKGVRYIDDVCFRRAANEASSLLTIDYGISFGSLEICLAKANFVGLTISNDFPPAICVYDRRLEFECDVIRLPHASSALASHIAPAMVCGKLCRAWGLSSSRAAFAEQACITALLAAGRNTALNAIKKGWGLFLRRLQPDFVLDERLSLIKNCCVALADLPKAAQDAHLSQLYQRARNRQKSSPCVKPDVVLRHVKSVSFNQELVSAKRRYGITNVGQTCYLAVSLQIIATLKARAPDSLILRAANSVLDARRTYPRTGWYALLVSVSKTPMLNSVPFSVSSTF